MMAINDEGEIRELLGRPRRIAVVGASPNPARPSNGVLAFLMRQGHDVIAVNPGHAGSTIHGAPVVATLANVEPPAEIVDIFRNSEDAGAAVDEAIVHGAKAVWLQMGVINEAAAKRAEAAGLLEQVQTLELLSELPDDLLAGGERHAFRLTPLGRAVAESLPDHGRVGALRGMRRAAPGRGRATLARSAPGVWRMG